MGDVIDLDQYRAKLPEQAESWPLTRYNPSLEFEAEESECAHRHLDDQSVPRANEEGRVFSLVGRIMRLRAVAASTEGRE